MTGRSTPEWIGKTADSVIPPRVKLRVFERATGCCQKCQRKIAAGDKWQADHVIALTNGGENRESNLQCLCDWCHKRKTAGDVAEKSSVRQRALSHRGIKKPSRMPGSRNSPFKIKLDGTVIDRRTGLPLTR